MSERVLHEWTTNSGRRFRLFDDGSIRLDKENGRMFLSGWEPAFVSELVRLASINSELLEALQYAHDHLALDHYGIDGITPDDLMLRIIGAFERAGGPL